jgi:predicted small secreted protein
MRLSEEALIILVALSALIFTGCATILHGSHQDIQVKSAPANVSVYMHGVKAGDTPVTLHLKRNKHYTLVLKKDGYKSTKVQLNKNFKPLPSILGNIFWNGVIGVVVDLATGAAYKLSPEQINKNLDKLKNAGYLPGITHVSKNEIDVVMLTKKEWKSALQAN